MAPPLGANRGDSLLAQEWGNVEVALRKNVGREVPHATGPVEPPDRWGPHCSGPDHGPGRFAPRAVPKNSPGVGENNVMVQLYGCFRA